MISTTRSQAGRTRTGVIAAIALLLAALIVPAMIAAPSAGAAQTGISDGTLKWGVRESFRTYITGPIAHGTIKAGDSASLDPDNVATFTHASGTVKDGAVKASYKGKIAFHGHAGALDFTLADPELILDAKGNGTLSFSYTEEQKPAKRIVLADLKSASVTFSGKQVTLDKAATKLARTGVAAFSYQGHGFYSEGDALDPLSTKLSLRNEIKETPKPERPKTEAPGQSPSKSPTSTPSTSSAPSAPATAPPASASSLTWGVKSSFRSYIAGPIAHGRITVSKHASATGGGFRFPQKSTTAKPPSATGTTQYTGSVNFYGHAGVLNLTLSNPRVVIKDASSGELILDYSVNGQAKSSVSMARLDLSRGKKSTNGSSVTYQGVPATLTQSGTKPFEWEGRAMYTAGTTLDSVSFTIGDNAKVSDSGGSSVVTSDVAGPTGSADSSGSASTGSPAPSAGAPSTAPGAGVLVWGVRSSFRSYILGPIAHGSITTAGGASGSGGAWAFPQSGNRAADGGASYRGSVRFYGHNGILNITFADPAVRLTGSNSATLSFSVNGSRKDMVTLDLSRASKSETDGATTYAGAPATLTSAGSSVFSYQGSSFYPAGSAMDPVTFTVGSPSSTSAAGSTTSSGGTSTGDTTSAGDTAGDSSSATGSSPSPSEAPKHACVATGRDLKWGFKESFRSYVSGSIANGDWSPSGGATYSIPQFVWAKGDGNFTKDGKAGLVTFPGSIHFTGHDGALDTTVAKPRIELTDDGKAFLRMDVTSTIMDAALEGRTERVTKTNIRFVELDRSKITISKQGDKSLVSGSGVPTKITAEGSAAFPNYTTGTAFDPVSFTISTGAKCAGPASSGAATQSNPAASKPAAVAKTPAKGSSDNGAFAWIGGGALGVLLSSALIGGAWARSNSRNAMGGPEA